MHGYMYCTYRIYHFWRTLGSLPEAHCWRCEKSLLWTHCCGSTSPPSCYPQGRSHSQRRCWCGWEPPECSCPADSWMWPGGSHLSATQENIMTVSINNTTSSTTGFLASYCFHLQLTPNMANILFNSTGMCRLPSRWNCCVLQGVWWSFYYFQMLPSQWSRGRAQADSAHPQTFEAIKVVYHFATEFHTLCT